MESFETPRLILRQWRAGDLDDFYSYSRDPLVGPGAGWKPHESREESRRVLQSFLKSGEVYALELKESGKAVGSLGLHRSRLVHTGLLTGEGREIGYALSRSCWGRGLMTEAVKGAERQAFLRMGLDYLLAAHFPSNVRSKRVIEKCGFQYAETLRGSYSDYRGRKMDEVVYLLTKEEYSRTAGLS